MKPENFENDYNQLIKEMKDRMNEPENNREIITDGVMKPDEYFKNKIKLAWILKEPYDGVNGTGGNWSYFEMFPENTNLYKAQFNRGHKTTWHPIIYVSFAIHNDFQKWDQMPYLREKNEMCDVVRNVAFVNSQKLPSKGVTRTNFNDLHESMSKNSELLLRQLALLNPNVLIFANTFHLYRPFLNLQNVSLINSGSLSFISINGKLYIDAYHPAQTTVKRQNYVDDIIELVEKWSKGELN